MKNRDSDAIAQASLDLASSHRDRLVMPGHHSFGGQLRLLRMALIFVPLIATIIFAALSWRAIEARSEREATANASLIRDYTLRLVDAQELLLQSAQSAIGELRNTPDRDLRAHRFLATLDSTIGGIARLALVSENGDFLLSSTHFPARGNVVDRDYFKSSLAGANPYIDRLIVQPENEDVFMVTRASTDPAVPGVWNSAVNIEVVTNFLSQISPQVRNAAALLREDGKVLARHVPSAEVVVLGPDHPVMEGIAKSDRGTYIATSATDQIRRSYAYQRIGTLPIFAIAGISRSGIVWTWFWQTLLFGAMSSLVGLAGLQIMRVEVLRRTQELEKLLHEFERERLEAAEKTAAFRETMLHELNHRVKNSLAMISSLIQMERRRTDGPDLSVINARVLALAHIHDMLHRSSRDHLIDLWALIHDICTNEAVIQPEQGVRIECSGSSTWVDDRLASPIALTLIELVTNAQKHAFDGRGGTILVTLETVGGDALLRVTDDGRGLPKERTRSSGLRIVEGLIMQIDGQLDIASSSDGTDIKIVFPIT